MRFLFCFTQRSKFGVRLDYDPTTHHYSDNTPAHVKLEDYTLTLFIKRSSDSEEHTQDPETHHQTMSEVIKELDLRKYDVVLVPDEVAKNRKRRWSRKFPICLCHKQSHHSSFYLFPPTAKLKEMWFRRLKSCSQGVSVKEIVKEQREFYSYMKYYMPKSISDSEKLKQERKKKKKTDNSLVHFSMKATEESVEEGDSAVSIDSKQQKGASGGTKSSSVPIPPALCADMDWLNAGLARICWDIWHERRWHDWVEAKIQRRISRIKTPSWMEPLTVTDVQLGKTIPTVKRIYAPPKLDNEGVWVYLAVQYKGSFNMTLETKLRLGKGQKDETDSQQQPHVISGRKPSLRQRKTPVLNKLVHGQEGSVDSDDIDSDVVMSMEYSADEQLTHKRSMPQSISSSSSSMSSLNLRNTKMAGDPVVIDDSVGSDLDSGSDDDGDVSASSSLSTSPNISHLENALASNVSTVASAQVPYLSRPGKWKNMFDRLKNSTIVQKAANTRIVRMAAEKMSSYNLYLTVEVKALDGFLAVNMSPPPSDILW